MSLLQHHPAIFSIFCADLFASYAFSHDLKMFGANIWL